MSNSPQRSFAGGEIAPALYARADLARYAIGLRTCRNMVVMRAGGATKRPGTKFVNTIGVSPAFKLTITPALDLAVSQTGGLVATLVDSLGRTVTGQTITWESDDISIATVSSTGDATASVHGVAGGTIAVRAQVVALGLTSNDCTVTVEDFYILHAFTSNLTFHVASAPGGATVRALIIAGGGSGGSVDGVGVNAGGGGAGGFQDESAVAVAAGDFPVAVGSGGPRNVADHTIAGGVFGAVPGNNGNDSSFAGLTSVGGGFGGGESLSFGRSGNSGGSGGGSASSSDSGFGGAGTSGQGHAGANGTAGPGPAPGGGGGGAGAVGGAGAGGAGASSDITGTAVTYCKGGNAVSGPGANGTQLGDGGEGGGNALMAQGGHGADGIVYIRYAASTGIVATGGIVTTVPI